MPITPKFSVTQSDEYVIVNIKVPHIRVASTEIIAEDENFSFYCHPYLLKLVLPFHVIGDDERCRAAYDLNDDFGALTCYLPKLTFGQHFPDLDLTTKLLQKRSILPHRNTIPTIDLISETSCSTDFDGPNDDQCLDLDQLDSDSPIQPLKHGKLTYGFQNRYSNVLIGLSEDMVGVLELTNPDEISPDLRRLQRLETENLLFDPSRYVADLIGVEQDYIFNDAYKYDAFWTVQWEIRKKGTTRSKPSTEMTIQPTTSPVNVDATEKINSGPVFGDLERDIDSEFSAAGGFSPEEQHTLSHSLVRKEYFIAIGSKAESSLLLGLIDLLFGIAYEHRITCGDYTVESPSNITRMSATLSWLDAFDSANGENAYTVVRHCCRRSLIYPYLRSWKLTRKVG